MPVQSRQTKHPLQISHNVWQQEAESLFLKASLILTVQALGQLKPIEIYSNFHLFSINDTLSLIAP